MKTILPSVIRLARQWIIIALLLSASGCITSSLQDSTVPTRMPPLTGIATSPTLPGKIILSYGYAQFGDTGGSFYSLDEMPLHATRLIAIDVTSTAPHGDFEPMIITDQMKAFVNAAPSERLLHPPADLHWASADCSAVKINAVRDDTLVVHIRERGLSDKVAGLNRPDGVQMIERIPCSDDSLLVPVMPSAERRRRKAAVAAGLPFAIVADILLSPLELPILVIAHGYGNGP